MEKLDEMDVEFCPRNMSILTPAVSEKRIGALDRTDSFGNIRFSYHKEWTENLSPAEKMATSNRTTKSFRAKSPNLLADAYRLPLPRNRGIYSLLMSPVLHLFRLFMRRSLKGESP